MTKTRTLFTTTLTIALAGVGCATEPVGSEHPTSTRIVKAPPEVTAATGIDHYAITRTHYDHEAVAYNAAHDIVTTVTVFDDGAHGVYATAGASELSFEPSDPGRIAFTLDDRRYEVGWTKGGGLESVSMPEQASPPPASATLLYDHWTGVEDDLQREAAYMHKDCDYCEDKAYSCASWQIACGIAIATCVGLGGDPPGCAAAIASCQAQQRCWGEYDADCGHGCTGYGYDPGTDPINNGCGG